MNIYEEIASYMEIIDELNELITPYQASNHETVYNFTLYTNGYYSFITYGEVILWSSEEDEREYNENLNDYEDMRGYLIRKFKEYVNNQREVLNLLK